MNNHIFRCISALFLLTIFVIQVSSQCHQCFLQSTTACVSRTTFKNCTPGEDGMQIIGDPILCPDNQICGFGGTCQPDSELVLCDDCGKCSGTRNFTCLDYDTYVPCIGSNPPLPALAKKCAPRSFCTVDSPKMCAFKETDEVFPTCNQVVVPTPTVPTAIEFCSGDGDCDEFCAKIGVVGPFPYEDPTKCNIYVQCTYNTSTRRWVGYEVYCPNKKYFQSSTKTCVEDASIPDCMPPAKMFWEINYNNLL